MEEGIGAAYLAFRKTFFLKGYIAQSRYSGDSLGLSWQQCVCDEWMGWDQSWVEGERSMRREGRKKWIWYVK